MSFVTIWGFELCDKFSSWVLSKVKLWSFITNWVFKFCHILIFFTIWVLFIKTFVITNKFLHIFLFLSSQIFLITKLNHHKHFSSDFFHNKKKERTNKKHIITKFSLLHFLSYIFFVMTLFSLIYFSSSHFFFSSFISPMSLLSQLLLLLLLSLLSHM